MKNFFTKMMLGSALVLCAASSASASQLLVFVTAQQIINAVNSSTFSGNCQASLTDCGVFAVGAKSVVDNGTTSTTITGYQSPIASGTAAWIATPVNTYNGYEIGSTANGVSQETFITGYSNPGNPSSGPAGKTYTGNISGTSNTGTAAMNATTQIGFLIDFGATNITTATTANLTLQLFATVFNGTTDASQFTKSVGATVTINNLATTALPEPSSIGLVLGGIGAIGFGSWRRRKMAAVPQHLQ